jgi:hypothetical protein
LAHHRAMQPCPDGHTTRHTFGGDNNGTTAAVGTGPAAGCSRNGRALSARLFCEVQKEGEVISARFGPCRSVTCAGGLHTWALARGAWSGRARRLWVLFAAKLRSQRAVAGQKRCKLRPIQAHRHPCWPGFRPNMVVKCTILGACIFCFTMFVSAVFVQTSGGCTVIGRSSPLWSSRHHSTRFVHRF